MTEHDEKLAYLLDDYVDENSDAALDEVIGDVNLQYRMRRYQMIGEAMRHELPAAIEPDFHKSVMARVHAEAAIAKASKNERPRHQGDEAKSFLNWTRIKPFAGLAVAASVALVTVAMWQPLQQEAGQPADELVSADQQKLQQLAGQPMQGSAVPVSTRIQTLGTRWNVEQDMPGLQQKLNAYLVNHTEYSNSVQGLIPQARVAGFDAQQ